MLKEGTIGAKWDQVEEGIPHQNPHWYEKVDFNSLEIPFAERPKGKSVKIIFYAQSGLGDKAIEIREAAPWKFKHTGDVNRNAHYIGMYILEQMFVKNRKNSEEEAIYKEAVKISAKIKRQENLRETFQKFYDCYVQGLVPCDFLCSTINHISDKIKDKELKEWFVQDCEKMLESDAVFIKAKHKIKMRESRMRVVSVGSEQ